MKLIINKVFAVAACGLSLAACSSMPSWMQFETAPVVAVVQLESEPPGAEARTSTGQICRTPCSVSLPPQEFTVSFALPGYQPQTVPVRPALASDPPSPNTTAEGPRLVPNPVFVELQPAAPPPARKRPVRRKPAVAAKPAAKPSTTASGSVQPAPPPSSPAPAPASPWPPAPSR